MAGFSVGVIALPLAMAFAIGSGVAPERGLFTAIVAGFIISCLGGSRVQIGGPTGAFVVITYNIVQRYGYEGLALATFLAGCILIGFGALRAGMLIRFIPFSVTTGFTTGIATAIFLGQIKDFCGLAIGHTTTSFLTRMQQCITALPTAKPQAILISLLALAIIIAVRSFSKRVPASLIALVCTTAIVFFFDVPVDTIEKTFGTIPSALPPPSLPFFSIESIQMVFPDAMALAILGGMESLLSAVVADGMTGYRHKSNCELVAQGLANISSSIFGGIPAAGAISRTATNIELHGRTPISGIIHAITLFLLMVLCAPIAGKIPLGALSAILIVVAWNMSELAHCREILRGPKRDAAVLVVTYLLTVFIGLRVAVQAGVMLSAILFLQHITEKTSLRAYQTLQAQESGRMDIAPDPVADMTLPAGWTAFEIEGPFFFGVSDILLEALKLQDPKPKTFILRLRSVPLIDGSGCHALKQFWRRLQSEGIEFYVTEARSDVLATLEQTKTLSAIGRKRFVAHFKDLIPTLPK